MTDTFKDRAEDVARRVHDRLPRPWQRAWTLIGRTGREAVDDRVPGLAAEIALFTMISLPALILVVLGSLGFVADALGPAGAQELNRIVFELPRGFFSDRVYASYENLATRVLADGRADVISIGALLSLWTGSRATNRALETITIAYDIDRPRPGWRRRLLALGLTVAGLLAAIAILPLLVLGPRVVEWLAPEAVASATLTVLGALYWPVLGLLAITALASLYHLGVPWRTPWRRDLPGAALAMIVWLLAAAGLRAYLAATIGSDAVFSQLAVPIAIVLWLYVSSVAVLLGAELNAEIERMWPTTGLRPDLGPGEPPTAPVRPAGR
ncbi:YihY family protein [Aeromicrobium marinum DSM 15272]|uniref:YihY family protein n=1 Tax=Aeromicrobium marinum DSM 15272 TaxID=585531 RepID=E2SEL0_9ACTN|nr:YihY/virulence factor BrkB family protein [Aeromicrobium marinum]EFQ82307.1 YihY family protein [Aeromicrobium marinum DSM 15272]